MRAVKPHRKRLDFSRAPRRGYALSEELNEIQNEKPEKVSSRGLRAQNT